MPGLATSPYSAVTPVVIKWFQFAAPLRGRGPKWSHERVDTRDGPRRGLGDDHPRPGGTDSSGGALRTRPLREALLEHDLEVYGSVSRRANCGGRGLCGTCGVRVREGTPEPEQWHDAAAERWGYPRLSCQMRVTEPITIELVEKVVWGQLLPD